MAAANRIIGSDVTVLTVGGTSILGLFESADLETDRPLVEVTAIKDTDGKHNRTMHGNTFVNYTLRLKKKSDTSSMFQDTQLMGAGTVAWAFTENGASGNAYSGTGYVQRAGISVGDGPQTEEVTIEGEGAITIA